MMSRWSAAIPRADRCPYASPCTGSSIQHGDDVWVTGTLGDAAAALSQWRAGGAADPQLLERLDRPQPRVAAGRALARIAHACIDISDGLLADLGHLCSAADVAARFDVDALPASATLRALFTDETRRLLQGTGGDDYELCFTAAPAQRAAIADLAQTENILITRIGEVTGGSGVTAFDREGNAWSPAHPGFDHFIAVR
jgi:thiamine-monophosphate kinase